MTTTVSVPVEPFGHTPNGRSAKLYTCRTHSCGFASRTTAAEWSRSRRRIVTDRRRMCC